MSSDAIVIIHTMSTLAMAGIIWFVQIVHYPILARAETNSSTDISREHQRRTGRVVVPLMLAEAVTAILLVIYSLSWIDRNASVVGLILLAIIWISTATLQMPCHRRLAKAYDAAVGRRLVRTNWIRTVAWTLRAFVAMAILWW
jgi:hypothetical protein